MIQHDLGVSLMPSWTVQEEIKNGKLALVRIKRHALKRSVAMVSLKGSKSAPIRAFLAYILERKEKLQTLATNNNDLQEIRIKK